MLEAWQNDGWELVDEWPTRFRTELSFRQAKPNPRWGLRAIAGGLVLVIVAGLAFAWFRTPSTTDRLAQLSLDASAAVDALVAGDLVTLDQKLAANRGQPDFAYFFASQATPRALGDAVASVAGSSGATQFKADIDTHAYDLTLTDLAGTLALATYGTTGDRALPTEWTDNFIAATTLPGDLYAGDDSSPDSATAVQTSQMRADQDLANKQNLLLLLSRGYWSTDFLEAVTRAYWDFDHAEGADAWPDSRIADARYAPAPNGTYLTDGLLALTAALTANPAASKWAFNDFQPDVVDIDGSDYTVGTFTHYLLFEHHFPEASDGGSIGMTATLTALSSAIDAIYGPAAAEVAAPTDASSDGAGALHDSVVLQAVARDLADASECSWNPTDYWNCATAAAKAVWHWVERWGHTVLDILSLTTFAPPPFTVIGVAAASTNATWYVIDGDYAMAGLSLATAVPGLAFGKIAKGVKAGVAVEKGAAAAADVVKVAAKSDEVAAASRQIQAGVKVATARELAEAGALRVEKSPTLFPLESEAEKLVASEMPGSVTQYVLDPPGCVLKCLGRRFVDVWDSRTATAVEVKIGSRNEAHTLAEIDKDLALLKAGTVKKLEYRFYPDLAGRLGPSAAVREKLLANNIPYAMYAP